MSDGAASFYLDHFVRSRISKVTYGHECGTLYRPELADHRERVSTAYTSPCGLFYIGNAFDIILPKVCPTLAFSCRVRKSTFVVYRTRQSQRPKNSGGPTSLHILRQMKQGVCVASLLCAIEALWSCLSGKMLIVVRPLSRNRFSSFIFILQIITHCSARYKLTSQKFQQSDPRKSMAAGCTLFSTMKLF